MTKTEIRKTRWAKTFKKESSYYYEKAIQYASDSNTEYIIYKTDELRPDVFQYAVASADADFWMDAFDTKKEALALCKEMGWKLI